MAEQLWDKPPTLNHEQVEQVRKIVREEIEHAMKVYRIAGESIGEVVVAELRDKGIKI